MSLYRQILWAVGTDAAATGGGNERRSERRIPDQRMVIYETVEKETSF